MVKIGIKIYNQDSQVPIETDNFNPCELKANMILGYKRNIHLIVLICLFFLVNISFDDDGDNDKIHRNHRTLQALPYYGKEYFVDLLL